MKEFLIKIINFIIVLMIEMKIVLKNLKELMLISKRPKTIIINL